MNAFAKIRKALNTGDANDLLAAMDALAELERAAAQPVAWMWNDELGIPHASAGSKKPIWLESSASAEYIKQANLRPLYAAPPAPVAEIREVVHATAEMSSRDATEYRLGSLLAVIHRDGGHYQTEHGTEKACADAELAVHVQRGIADGYHDAIKIWRHRAEQLAIEADAEIAGLRADAERIDAQWRDELRIYRETENKRISELEQSVTVRDAEIARLETDLELARGDAGRWRKLRAMNWTQKDAFAVVDVSSLRLGTLTYTHDRLDAAIDAARAGNGGWV